MINNDIGKLFMKKMNNQYSDMEITSYTPISIDSDYAAAFAKIQLFEASEEKANADEKAEADKDGVSLAIARLLKAYKTAKANYSEQDHDTCAALLKATTDILELAIKDEDGFKKISAKL